MTTRAPAPAYGADRAARAGLAIRLHELYGRDLVFRYRLTSPRGYDFISRSCIAMSGYTPDEFYHDGTLALRIVHPEDRATLQAVLAGAAVPSPCMLRWVRRDGTTLWTEQHLTQVRDDAGGMIAVEGLVKDVTQMAIANDAARSSQLGTRAFLEAAQVPGVILDPMGRLIFANEAFLRLVQWTWDDLAGRDWDRLFHDPTHTGPDLAAAIAGTAGPVARFEVTAPLRRRDGRLHIVSWSAMRVLDARGQLTGIAAIGEDRTTGDATRLNLAELAAAVELTNDSVIVADLSARIQYVNAAFERATGYKRDEVIGRNPNILSSGHQTPGFYRAMWFMLTHGRNWRGELINRRKDGELLIEEALITPVRNAANEVAAYVAVKRDVTKLREMRASLDDARHQREILTTALDRLRPRPTARESCEDIAAILAELPGVAVGAVALFEWSGAEIVAAVTTAIDAVPTGITIPDEALGRIIDHPGQGPWIEPLDTSSDCPFVDAYGAAGVRSVLYAPIRSDGALLGIMTVGSLDPDGRDLTHQQASVSHVAAVARGLLAPHMAQKAAEASQRGRVLQVISDSAFTSYFQPIVDLFTGRVVGFEALTRFSSGVGPAEQFAEAAACGLGLELELATIAGALSAARELPPGGILTLNASPELILDGAALASILVADGGRRLVLEVTEHSAIDDYAAFATAVKRLPNVRLAVDDAGAGAANLRHLVELRPDFVKLDVSLVRDVDFDLTRQAMIVGLKEFARVSGRALIAEGIETELERATLTELSVRFGQGYLLGAPAEPAAWSKVVIEDDNAWVSHPSAKGSMDARA